MANKLRLGDILVNQNKITEDQLQDALKAQSELGVKLGEAIVIRGYMRETDILKSLQEQLNVPYIDIDNYNIDKSVVKMLPEDIARKHLVLPISIINGKLLLLTTNPLDVVSLDDVKFITGFDLELALAEKDSINSLINVYYDGKEAAEKAIEEFQEDNIDLGLLQSEDIEEDDVANAPIVRLVNNILNQAVKLKVSDIHIEPYEDRIRIRFRVDGELVEQMTSTLVTHSPIIARLKIIGGMDISEKRKPQDGRLETKINNKKIDLRISIIPTVYGEKSVIRLLDRDSVISTKEELGFTKDNMDLFDKLIKVPEGMILVTGPTGSGKTTTLFTVLGELNTVNRNLITVEDPVEYRLDGVNQVQVNEKAGLTFASSLRSILRQDPDIVMVGEIRDAETAQITTRAAITGHIVLSTLHTNDSVSSVIRLIDMGVERFLVSASVSGVIAQRLIKKICPKCSMTYQTSKEEMDILNIDEPITVYKGSGCAQCHQTGYLGRVAIHEIFILDSEIKNMLNRNKPIDEIKRRAIEKGMTTLHDNAKRLVKVGITTVNELVRVAYTIDKE